MRAEARVELLRSGHDEGRRAVKGSILYKAWMALTGLFLVLFLLVHFLGNLQLFLPEAHARDAFNTYAHLLGSSLPIKVAAWGTYASIVAHAALGAWLSWRNRGARPRYAVRPTASPWYARSMGTLGAVTLVFIVVHMQTFWYRYTWGDIGLDAQGHKDLYTVVTTAFAQPWIVAVHMGSMAALGFHLQQGIPAGLRSLGVYGGAVLRRAPRVAAWLSWGLAVGFAAMPLFIYLGGHRL